MWCCWQLGRETPTGGHRRHWRAPPELSPPSTFAGQPRWQHAKSAPDVVGGAVNLGGPGRWRTSDGLLPLSESNGLGALGRRTPWALRRQVASVIRGALFEMAV